MPVDRDRRAVDAFYMLFGASILATVITEIATGVWGVHAGTLYPWRHIEPFPVYGVGPLVVEWTLLAFAAVAVAIGVRRKIAARVLLVVTMVSLTQRYSNARALALIVLFFIAFDPGEAKSGMAARLDHPSFTLVRAQLVIVYLFSAANKVAAGFLSGATLVNLLGVSIGVGRAMAVATVIAELALPALLVWKPRIALPCVVALHLGFAIALPGLWPFTILMIAMATLFEPRARSRTSPRLP
jgi:hypothetical protein